MPAPAGRQDIGPSVSFRPPDVGHRARGGHRHLGVEDVPRQAGVRASAANAGREQVIVLDDQDLKWPPTELVPHPEPGG